MTMRAASFVPLCLAALLALAVPAALAKSSQEMPANTGQPAQAPSAPQSAMETMAKTVKAISQHNQATATAAAQAEAEARPAQPQAQAPAQKSGAGKAIYGDIIVHK